MIKKCCLLFFFLSSLILNAQDAVNILNKKQFGYYQGTISSYSIFDGNTEMHVEPTQISVQLLKNFIEISIGNLKHKGNYSILFTTKEFAVIEVTYEDPMLKDRFVVYTQGDKIVRDGVLPQLNTSLKKMTKKEIINLL